MPFGIAFAAFSFMSISWRVKRDRRNGMVPPECEKIQRMSGYRAAVPLNTRLAMVRVVSVEYSTTAGGTSLLMLRQQSGERGWVYTTALRRLGSSPTGAEEGAPGGLFW